jgi:fatty acid desaturase
LAQQNVSPTQGHPSAPASADGDALEAAGEMNPGASSEPLIDPAIVRQLSRVNPIASTAWIALEYALIAAAIALSERFWHTWLYPLVWVFIGARLHDIASLLHEGTHWRLYRNRRSNDAVSRWLLGTPLLLPLGFFRIAHLEHHHHPLDRELDPTLYAIATLPMTRVRLVREIVQASLGGTLAQFARVLFRRAGLGGKVALLVFAAVLVAAPFESRAARLVWLYWFLPLTTWTALVNRLREIVEHYIVAPDHPFHQRDPNYLTRLVVPTLASRILVGGSHHHLPHHLYPSVPIYRLSTLHSALMKNPQYAARAHVVRGYVRALLECVQRTPALVRPTA